MKRSGVTLNGRRYWHQHFEGLSDLVSFFPYAKEKSARVDGSELEYVFAKSMYYYDKNEKGEKVKSEIVLELEKEANKIVTGNFSNPSHKEKAKKLEEFSVQIADFLIKNTKDLDQYVETDLRFGSRFNATQYILGSETPFSRVRESDDALHGVGRHVTVWINTEMLASMSENNLFWLVASGVAVCKALRMFGYNTQICGYTLGYCNGCDAMQTYEIIPFGEEFDYEKIVALAIRPKFLSYIWNGYIECPWWDTSSYGGGRSLRNDEHKIYGMEKDIVMQSPHYNFDKNMAEKIARENLERYINDKI